MKTLIQKTLWKGTVLIDIRKHFLKDGELIPSRKGISLSPRQFEYLIKKFADSYEWSAEEFINALPIDLDEEYLFASKVDVSFQNGEVDMVIDPSVAALSFKEILPSLMTGVIEFSAENDIDPKDLLSRLFRFL